MTPKDESVDLKAKGNKCFASHEWLNAIDYYTKAIEMYDQDPSYYCNRAQVVSPRKAHFNGRFSLTQIILRPILNLNSMAMPFLMQPKLSSSTQAMLKYVTFLVE